MKRPLTYAAFLLALDAAAVLLTLNVARWLWLVKIQGIVRPDEHGWVIGPLLLPLALVVVGFYLIEGYKARTDMMGLDYTSEHLIALAASLLGTLLLAVLFVRAGEPLSASRGAFALGFIALMPVTLSYRRALHAAQLRGRRARTLVFVGDAASAAEFSAECARQGLAQPALHASIGDASGATFPGGQLTPFDEVLRQVDEGRLEVEAIVLRESGRELPAAVSRRLTELYFHGVPTYTLELFHDVYWRKIPLYRLNQTWLFQEGFQIAREPVFERLKRLSDITLATVGLLVASPVLALAALAIWLEDRGPVFFRQTRVGKNHAPFPLFKLRTMRVSPPGAAGPRYTEKGDVRITRVGRFLRASRLDEFPQLLNVLRGEMSMIGPRAEWDVLVRDYEAQIPCYHFRHLVKPGITGWAQVNYPYGASLDDTLRKLEYDLYYIRHFSFLIDAAIVLKTVHIMIFGKGR
jgi:exopolysaccharide biosynthesis polyprenyl glycosylphosphotransferase